LWIFHRQSRLIKLSSQQPTHPAFYYLCFHLHYNIRFIISFSTEQADEFNFQGKKGLEKIRYRLEAKDISAFFLFLLIKHMVELTLALHKLKIRSNSYWNSY